MRQVRILDKYCQSSFLSKLLWVLQTQNHALGNYSFFLLFADSISGVLMLFPLVPSLLPFLPMPLQFACLSHQLVASWPLCNFVFFSNRDCISQSVIVRFYFSPTVIATLENYSPAGVMGLTTTKDTPSSSLKIFFSSPRI